MHTNKNLLLGYIHNVQDPAGITAFAKSIKDIPEKTFDTTIIDTSTSKTSYDIEQVLRCCNINLIKAPKIIDHLYIDRFLAYSNYINTNKYTYVIVSDVPDVYLQKDPFFDLKNNDTNGMDLFLSSENILIQDSPWNYNIIKNYYGANIADHIKNNIVINSGVIYGKSYAIKQLCSNIRQEYLKKPIPFTGIDQGILMKLIYYDQIQTCTFAPHSLGLMAAAYFYYPDKLIQNYNTNINNITIVDGNDNLYAVVHQYNRSSSLKEKVVKFYEKR